MRRRFIHERIRVDGSGAIWVDNTPDDALDYWLQQEVLWDPAWNTAVVFAEFVPMSAIEVEWLELFMNDHANKYNGVQYEPFHGRRISRQRCT